MRKLKGIIINGEYLGNKVAYNGLFRTICNISPIIMLEFIKLVSQYGTLYSPIEIKGFDLPEAYRIIIKFENKKYRGYADLSFVIQNGKLILSESDVCVESIMPTRKNIEPEPVQEIVLEESEPVVEEEIEPIIEVPLIEDMVEEPVEQEPIIEEVIEPAIEEVVEEKVAPVPEPKPEKIVIEIPEYSEDPVLDELLTNANVVEEIEEEPAPVKEDVVNTPEPAAIEETKAEPVQNLPEPPQNEEIEEEITAVQEAEPEIVSEPEIFTEPRIEEAEDQPFISQESEPEEYSEPAVEEVEEEPFIVQEAEPEEYSEPAVEEVEEEPFIVQEAEPEIFHEPVVEEQPEAEPEILSEPVIEEVKMAVTAEPEVFQEAAVEEPELIEEEIIEEILESKEEPIIEPEAVKIQEKPVENTEIAEEEYKKIEYTPDTQNNLQDILENIIAQNITPEVVVKKVAAPREHVKPQKTGQQKKAAPKSPLQEYLNAIEVIAAVEKKAPKFKILQNGKRMDVKVIDENCFVVGETIYRWGDILYLKD